MGPGVRTARAADGTVAVTTTGAGSGPPRRSPSELQRHEGPV